MDTQAKPTVLVLGKTPDIMPHAIKALHDAGIDAIGVFHEFEAHAHILNGAVKVIAIGGGVSSEERQALKNWLAMKAPQVKALDIVNFSLLAETVKRNLT